MGNFDKEKNKISGMEYDKNRKRYIGKDSSEFEIKRYGDGSGYEYNYYDRSTYGNTKHNSTHVRSDMNQNWTRDDKNRDAGTESHSSGSGCYLTTACMKHLKDDFNDKCYELLVLRWFRDNFVSQEDIDHYYQTAPVIVDAINKQENCDEIYETIYERVIGACVNAIMSDDYEFAYIRYKESILQLEELYAREELQQRLIRAIS